MKIISIYGLPACGKTTQALKLAETFGLCHFGMGEKIRAEIQSGSELGKKIKSANDNGLLIPDELMFEIIKNCGQHAGEAGIVFDGFPRITDQAKMLDEILAESKMELDKFFYLKISREEAIARINKRAELTGRADDKDLDVVNNRIGVFNEQSSILIEYYRKQGKLIEIDGEQEIEKIFSEISSFLN